MKSRGMLIAFEELLRNTNPELEFDINVNTDTAFNILSRAEEEYISETFLAGDSIQDNINTIRKRSDVLKNLISRCAAVQAYAVQGDGGYLATFATDGPEPEALTSDEFWMFLGGSLSHVLLPTSNKGYAGVISDPAVASDIAPRIELDLINHYDLQKKVRTVNNEPIYKYIPVVLEGDVTFVFYLDKEKEDTIGGVNIDATAFHINYLARPSGIDLVNQPSLAPSTHNDIVKKAVDIFIVEYKYKLGVDSTKPNG